MHRVAALTLSTVLVLLGPGCLQVETPIAGGFTIVDTPLDTTTAARTIVNSKVGRSTAMSILGLVAVGDCSIQRAAERGEITRVGHVDQHVFKIFDYFALYSTIVYGD